MELTSDNPIDIYIVKYLQDDCTQEERLFLESWIAKSDANKSYYKEFKTIWKQSNDLDDFQKIDVDQQWQVFEEKTNISKKSKGIHRPFLKIAASVALLLGIAYFMNSLLFNEVVLIAEVGKENKFVLPDQSAIWLLEGSTLTYTKDFKGKKRTVELEGEGYFEVKKDVTKPFVVYSGSTRTEVLGTSFNLGTNPATKTTTLVLTEGKVAFSNTTEEVILLPGDKVIATPNGSLLKSVNNDQNYDSWRSGVLNFDNSSFAEVVTVLEKQYRHRFVIENKELFSCALTTRFDNESLEEVLQTLKILLGINFTIESGKSMVVIKDGGC